MNSGGTGTGIGKDGGALGGPKKRMKSKVKGG